jgi:hypothetical protein
MSNNVIGNLGQGTWERVVDGYGKVVLVWKPAVTGPPPLIVLGGGALPYIPVVGDTSLPGSIRNIANGGEPSSVLNWLASFSSVSPGISGKLSAVPSNGTIGGGLNSNFTISLDPTGVPAGDYSASLDISEVVYSGVTTQSLPVTVHVSPYYISTFRTRWTDTWTIPYPPGHCGWPPYFGNSVTLPGAIAYPTGYRRWGTTIDENNMCYLYVAINGGQSYIEVWGKPGLFWVLISTTNVTVAYDSNGCPYGSQMVSRTNYCANLTKIEWAASF